MVKLHHELRSVQGLHVSHIPPRIDSPRTPRSTPTSERGSTDTARSFSTVRHQATSQTQREALLCNVPDNCHRPANDLESTNLTGSWIWKLFEEPEDDVGTCCEGFWSPCSLYAKTQHRLKRIAAGQDGDLTDYNACNWGCVCYLAAVLFAFPFHCYYVCLQQTQVRAGYNTKGSIAKDCAAALFCGQCALMQAEREVRAREGLGQKPYSSKMFMETVHQQPSQEPGMAHPLFNLSPIQALPTHRDSLPSASLLPTNDGIKVKKIRADQKRLHKEKKEVIASTQARSTSVRLAGSALNPIAEASRTSSLTKRRVTPTDNDSEAERREIINTRQPWRNHPIKKTVIDVNDSCDTIMSGGISAQVPARSSSQEKQRAMDLTSKIPDEASSANNGVEEFPSDAVLNNGTDKESTLVYYGSEKELKKLRVSDCCRRHVAASIDGGCSLPVLTEASQEDSSALEEQGNDQIRIVVEHPIEDCEAIHANLAKMRDEEQQVNDKRIFEHEIQAGRSSQPNDINSTKGIEQQHRPEDTEITGVDSTTPTDSALQHILAKCHERLGNNSSQPQQVTQVTEHVLGECQITENQPSTAVSVEQHDLAGCSTITITLPRVESDCDAQHALVECESIDQPDESVATNNEPMVQYQHKLGDCDVVEISVKRIEQPEIGDCNVVRGSTKILNQADQHDITLDDVVKIIVEAANVHDLKDDVLEPVDDIDVKEHDLRDDVLEPVDDADIEEHDLRDCDVLKVVSVPTRIQRHIADSNGAKIEAITRGHDLRDCDTIESVVISGTTQHRIQDCDTIDRPSARQASQSLPSPQERLDDWDLAKPHKLGTSSTRSAPGSIWSRIFRPVLVEKRSSSQKSIQQPMKDYNAVDLAREIPTSRDLSLTLLEEQASDWAQTRAVSGISSIIPADELSLDLPHEEEHATSQHNLNDCEATEVVAALPVEQHTVDECEAAAETALPPVAQAEQHSLDACDLIQDANCDVEHFMPLGEVHSFVNQPHFQNHHQNQQEDIKGKGKELLQTDGADDDYATFAVKDNQLLRLLREHGAGGAGDCDGVLDFDGFETQDMGHSAEKFESENYFDCAEGNEHPVAADVIAEETTEVKKKAKKTRAKKVKVAKSKQVNSSMEEIVERGEQSVDWGRDLSR